MDGIGLIENSRQLQEQAEQVISDTNVLDIWRSIGAEINPVGSLAMGLMMNNRDIDFHIYTDPFRLSESFKAIALLAENPYIRSIAYTNLLEEEDRCIEWHAIYRIEQGEEWKLDMIHILKDSPYAGYFEQVAEQIKKRLTEGTRMSILDIKNSIHEPRKVMGIRIYRAVLEGGVRNLEEFDSWDKNNANDGIETWMPE